MVNFVNYYDDVEFMYLKSEILRLDFSMKINNFVSTYIASYVQRRQS